MFKLRKFLLPALLLAALGTAQADTLKMDGMSAGTGDAWPSRGMSQTSVQSKYGRPTAVKARRCQTVGTETNQSAARVMRDPGFCLCPCVIIASPLKHRQSNQANS
jgi:hypothetical protein